MAKRIGVILSGCGFKDGAEIHESVLTLLALDRAGAQVRCVAPNIDQRKVVNHLTGEESRETRNVLVESARIARGKIEDVASVRAAELDGLMLPGGFGAAMNLSDFGVRGSAATVDPGVGRLVADVHSQGKPIGAICIAPNVLALVLGSTGIHLTIGKDPSTAAALEALGCVHEVCETEGVLVDRKNKIVSTPAYMLGPSIANVAVGIEKAVAEVLRLA